MVEEGKIIAGPRPYGHKSHHSVAVPFAPVALRSRGHWGRWVLSTLAFLCLATAVAWSWIKYQSIPIFSIQNVKINGDYPHVDQALLRQTILPFTQRGLLTIDARSLQDRLQQLPWISIALVQRGWPHTLNITLTEKKPIARFDQQTLLSDQGELFTVKTSEIPPGLPLFITPQGQQGILLQNYLKMAAVLDPLKMKIVILELDARQSWRLQLDNGIVLFLGRIDPLKRLQRFVTLYPQLIGSKAVAVNYIDLRYANGVAVDFKHS